MKSMFLIFIVVYSFSAIGQGNTEKNKSIPFKIVVNWKYQNEIKVLDEPNGKVIKSIANDSLNENYINALIYESNKENFKGKFYFEITGDTVNGWVKKDKHFGAIMKHEDVIMNVTLYSVPKEQRNFVMIEITDWAPSFVTIEECDGYWAWITITHFGKEISGWIRYDKLCPNNYTTCS